jgi:hypothetical protein
MPLDGSWAVCGVGVGGSALYGTGPGATRRGLASPLRTGQEWWLPSDPGLVGWRNRGNAPWRRLEGRMLPQWEGGTTPLRAVRSPWLRRWTPHWTLLTGVSLAGSCGSHGRRSRCGQVGGLAAHQSPTELGDLPLAAGSSPGQEPQPRAGHPTPGLSCEDSLFVKTSTHLPKTRVV